METVKYKLINYYLKVLNQYKNNTVIKLHYLLKYNKHVKQSEMHCKKLCKSHNTSPW